MFANEININGVAEIKKEFTLFSLQQTKRRGQLQIVSPGLYNWLTYKVMMYFIHLIDLNGLKRDKNYYTNILAIFVMRELKPFFSKNTTITLAPTKYIFACTFLLLYLNLKLSPGKFHKHVFSVSHVKMEC